VEGRWSEDERRRDGEKKKNCRLNINIKEG